MIVFSIRRCFLCVVVVGSQLLEGGDSIYQTSKKKRTGLPQHEKQMVRSGGKEVLARYRGIYGVLLYYETIRIP